MLNFFKSLLGLNPSLPLYWKVPFPMHGQEAKNSYRQKVIFDENQINPVTGKPGRWVMSQNFTDKEPVTIK